MADYLDELRRLSRLFEGASMKWPGTESILVNWVEGGAEPVMPEFLRAPSVPCFELPDGRLSILCAKFSTNSILRSNWRQQCLRRQDPLANREGMLYMRRRPAAFLREGWGSSYYEELCECGKRFGLLATEAFSVLERLGKKRQPSWTSKIVEWQAVVHAMADTDAEQIDGGEYERILDVFYTSSVAIDRLISGVENKNSKEKSTAEPEPKGIENP